MSVPSSLQQVYDYVERQIGKPYVLGGGHSGFGTFGSYDCSGLASQALHAGGILESPFPLDTHGLERWGLPGEGEYFTLWVINEPGVIEHCVLQFKLPEHTQHHFIAARHSGTVIDWYPATEPAAWVVEGFHPRRRK